MRKRFGSLHSDELEFHGNLLVSQLLSIGVLILAWIFVRFVGWVAPGFFHHPNLTWSVSLGSLAKFRTLFVYAAIMTIGNSFFGQLEGDEDDEAVFALGLLTSVLAGIWEEIGYRWLYICTAMVGIVISNWLFGTAAGTVVALICLVLGVLAIFASENLLGVLGSIALILCAGFMIWMIWYKGYSDPVYWFYGHLLVPVVNFVTWGNFEPIFKNPTLPPLFVFGIIAANANFRDGHKYQGPIGMVNAWVIGFVMMYATIFYGIGTAIALHVIYDVEIDAIRYVFRKFNR